MRSLDFVQGVEIMLKDAEVIDVFKGNKLLSNWSLFKLFRNYRPSYITLSLRLNVCYLLPTGTQVEKGEVTQKPESSICS